MTTEDKFAELIGDDEVLNDAKVEVAKSNPKEEKMTATNNDKVEAVSQDVSMPKPLSGSGGKYFKMTKEQHAIRLHSFNHEGSMHGCIPVTKHWNGKRFEDCTGEKCEWCKKSETDDGITKSTKYRVNVVDRASKPNKVQIWEMPASAYKDVYKYWKNNGPEKTFGNSGRTFLLEYFKNDKKYSMTPYEKDGEITQVKPEEIYDLFDDDTRDLPDDEVSNEIKI